MSDNPYYCPTCSESVTLLEAKFSRVTLSLACPTCGAQLVTWAEAVRAGMVAKSA